MSLLKKQQIVEADDIKTEKLAVPEWGGEILIRSLDGDRYNEYLNFILQRAESGKSIKVTQSDGEKVDVNPDGLVLKVCALHIVDEQGKPMFTEAELRVKSYKALDRIFQACQKLSGLGKDETKEVAEGLKDAQS